MGFLPWHSQTEISRLSTVFEQSQPNLNRAKQNQLHCLVANNLYQLFSIPLFSSSLARTEAPIGQWGGGTDLFS